MEERSNCHLRYLGEEVGYASESDWTEALTDRADRPDAVASGRLMHEEISSCLGRREKRLLDWILSGRGNHRFRQVERIGWRTMKRTLDALRATTARLYPTDLG